MKIQSISAASFASYERLEIDLVGTETPGLTLISGTTGSGKSTFCDLIPWALFGKTAKNGAADDVLSWWGGVASVTLKGECANGDTLEVVRTRGKKARDNDLYFSVAGSAPVRGKDSTDTQKMLCTRLGYDADTYLAGSYYHEFSHTAQFFTATAKTRRQLCEQISDLSLPVSLQQKLVSEKKSVLAEISDIASRQASTKNAISLLASRYDYEFQKSSEWAAETEKKLRELADKAEIFDQENEARLETLIHSKEMFEASRSAEIQAINLEISAAISYVKPESYFDSEARQIANLEASIDPKNACDKCGGPVENAAYTCLQERKHELKIALLENTQLLYKISTLTAARKDKAKSVNPVDARIEAVKASTNTYLEEGQRLAKQKNPYTEGLYDLLSEKKFAEEELETLGKRLDKSLLYQADLDLLVGLVADLRSTLIAKTIAVVEHRTNDLLAQFFDAEIRASFQADEADKLEVTLFKDGNQCSYTQLSKGQRRMLNLCFAVAIMDCVRNSHPSISTTVFFDEALDGLADEIKTKAFNLFQHVAVGKDAVFVVDHSEAIKALFISRYDVSSVNGKSQLEKTTQ